MPDHFYVYPSYLKRAVPRSEGRRVPSSQAVTGELSAEAMADAGRALGFKVEVEPKHYPKEAWRAEGRIKVQKKKGVTKAQFVLRLAKEINRRGAAAPSAA
jgi:signal recognition particle subunit SEC65